MVAIVVVVASIEIAVSGRGILITGSIGLLNRRRKTKECPS
jgi:hypothetical protein